MRGSSRFAQTNPASAKVIGLIGGISPETTALYYRIIQEQFRAHGITFSPRILLHHVDGERLERCRHTDEKDSLVIEMLLSAAHTLRSDGAQCLALCADNLHAAAERVAAMLPDDIQLPLAVDTLGSALREAGLHRIALLGLPSDSPDQAYLAHTLTDRFDIETVGIATEAAEATEFSTNFPWLNSMAESAMDSMDAIVLSSTEMSLLFRQHCRQLRIPCIGAIERHAEAIVEAAIENNSPHLLPASYGVIGEYLYDAA